MLGFGFMFGKNNKRNEFGFKFFTFLVNETSRFKVSILTNMFIGSRCIFLRYFTSKIRGVSTCNLLLPYC